VPPVAKESRPLSLAPNVTALADALFTLLDNRAQAAAMGRTACELALDRFAWPGYLARLSELYARILDSQTTRHTCVD
jgi:glycosyltransferase involved in cell wall biosynthesis